MDENTMNQEMNNTETAPAETNGLVELAVKGAVGIAGLFTAYKVGKARAEKDGKPKRKLRFQSPIKFEETAAEPEEKEKTEEEVKTDQKDKK